MAALRSGLKVARQSAASAPATSSEPRTGVPEHVARGSAARCADSRRRWRSTPTPVSALPVLRRDKAAVDAPAQSVQPSRPRPLDVLREEDIVTDIGHSSPSVPIPSRARWARAGRRGRSTSSCAALPAEPPDARGARGCPSRQAAASLLETGLAAVCRVGRWPRRRHTARRRRWPSSSPTPSACVDNDRHAVDSHRLGDGTGGGPGFSYKLVHIYVDGALVDESAHGGSSLGFTLWGGPALAVIRRGLAVGVASDWFRGAARPPSG